MTAARDWARAVPAGTPAYELVRDAEFQALAVDPDAQRRVIAIGARVGEQLAGKAPLRPWREYSMRLLAGGQILLAFATVGVLLSMSILIGLSLEKVLAFPDAVVVSAVGSAVAAVLVWPAEALRFRNKEVGTRAASMYVTFIVLQVITFGWLLLRARWHEPGPQWLQVSLPASAVIPLAVLSFIAVTVVYHRHQAALVEDRRRHDAAQDATAASGAVFDALLRRAERDAASATARLSEEDRRVAAEQLNAALDVLEKRGLLDARAASVAREAPLGAAAVHVAIARVSGGA